MTTACSEETVRDQCFFFTLTLFHGRASLKCWCGPSQGPLYTRRLCSLKYARGNKLMLHMRSPKSHHLLKMHDGLSSWIFFKYICFFLKSLASYTSKTQQFKTCTCFASGISFSAQRNSPRNRERNAFRCMVYTEEHLIFSERKMF